LYILTLKIELNFGKLFQIDRKSPRPCLLYKSI